MSKYELKLKPGFPGPRRTRLGVTVPYGVGIQAELTKEQVQAFEADPEVVISAVKAKASDKKTAPAKKKSTPRKGVSATDKASDKKTQDDIDGATGSADAKQMVDLQDEKTA